MESIDGGSRFERGGNDEEQVCDCGGIKVDGHEGDTGIEWKGKGHC